MLKDETKTKGLKNKNKKLSNLRQILYLGRFFKFITHEILNLSSIKKLILQLI